MHIIGSAKNESIGCCNQLNKIYKLNKEAKF